MLESSKPLSGKVLSGFIVLEGIDGAGTSTQIKRVSEELKLDGHSLFSTYEPSDGPVGSLLRNILSGEINAKSETIALLFAADRNEHLFNPDNGIIKGLEENDFVISDRYLFSSLAYQSIDCGFDYVAMLNASYPLPEFLIYIDVPIEESQLRISKRRVRDIYDGLSFQEKVVRSYERAFDLYKESKMKFLRIDGRSSVEEISKEITDFILAHR